MRFRSAVILAGLLASPSLAWGALPNSDEVSVNPLPSGNGNTLLYPGGEYMRVVPPLLQPGQNSNDTGPIQLHMPGMRAPALPTRRNAAVAPAPPAAVTPPPRRVAVAPAPRPAPAAAPPAAAPKAAPKAASVKPAAPAKQTASAAPPSGGGYTPSYGIFAAPPGAGLAAEPPEPKRSEPPKQQVAKAEPPAPKMSEPKKSEPPKQQIAKAEPPPPARPLLTQEPPTPGLTKRSVILFSAGAADPAKKALDSIKFLAGDLNSAMVNAGSRIQLLAYGGEKGDKGSDARRLSLKRALAIRQVLIDDGVPSERIDVRAMGGADDGGPADRVDVFVKT